MAESNFVTWFDSVDSLNNLYQIVYDHYGPFDIISTWTDEQYYPVICSLQQAYLDLIDSGSILAPVLYNYEDQLGKFISDFFSWLLKVPSTIDSTTNTSSTAITHINNPHVQPPTTSSTTSPSTSTLPPSQQLHHDHFLSNQRQQIASFDHSKAMDQYHKFRRFQYHQPVSGCILLNNTMSKVLLGSLYVTNCAKEQFHLPRGKVLPNETPLLSAIRHVQSKFGNLDLINVEKYIKPEEHVTYLRVYRGVEQKGPFYYQQQHYNYRITQSLAAAALNQQQNKVITQIQQRDLQYEQLQQSNVSNNIVPLSTTTTTDSQDATSTTPANTTALLTTNIEATVDTSDHDDIDNTSQHSQHSSTTSVHSMPPSSTTSLSSLTHAQPQQQHQQRRNPYYPILPHLLPSTAPSITPHSTSKTHHHSQSSQQQHHHTQSLSSTATNSNNHYHSQQQHHHHSQSQQQSSTSQQQQQQDENKAKDVTLYIVVTSMTGDEVFQPPTNRNPLRHKECLDYHNFDRLQWFDLYDPSLIHKNPLVTDSLYLLLLWAQQHLRKIAFQQRRIRLLLQQQQRGEVIITDDKTLLTTQTIIPHSSIKSDDADTTTTTTSLSKSQQQQGHLVTTSPTPLQHSIMASTSSTAIVTTTDILSGNDSLSVTHHSEPISDLVPEHIQQLSNQSITLPEQEQLSIENDESNAIIPTTTTTDSQDNQSEQQQQRQVPTSPTPITKTPRIIDQSQMQFNLPYPLEHLIRLIGSLSTHVTYALPKTNTLTQTLIPFQISFFNGSHVAEFSGLDYHAEVQRQDLLNKPRNTAPSSSSSSSSGTTSTSGSPPQSERNSTRGNNNNNTNNRDHNNERHSQQSRNDNRNHENNNNNNKRSNQSQQHKSRRTNDVDHLSSSQLPNSLSIASTGQITPEFLTQHGRQPQHQQQHHQQQHIGLENPLSQPHQLRQLHQHHNQQQQQHQHIGRQQRTPSNAGSNNNLVSLNNLAMNNNNPTYPNQQQQGGKVHQHGTSNTTNPNYRDQFNTSQQPQTNIGVHVTYDNHIQQPPQQDQFQSQSRKVYTHGNYHDNTSIPPSTSSSTPQPQASRVYNHNQQQPQHQSQTPPAFNTPQFQQTNPPLQQQFYYSTQQSQPQQQGLISQPATQPATTDFHGNFYHSTQQQQQQPLDQQYTNIYNQQQTTPNSQQQQQQRFSFHGQVHQQQQQQPHNQIHLSQQAVNQNQPHIRSHSNSMNRSGSHNNTTTGHNQTNYSHQPQQQQQQQNQNRSVMYDYQNQRK